MLRDYDDVVRIFIYAPEAYKVRRVREIYGDSEEDAVKNVHRSDLARASYYKNISGTQWGSREQYDLLIDSSAGIDASAETICRYIQCREK